MIEKGLGEEKPWTEGHPRKLGGRLRKRKKK
jgi:hypothetical protein